MKLISSLADKGIIWIAAGVVMLFFKKTKSTGICVLVALLLDFLIVNICIKPLVARMRPFDINQSVKLILDAPKDFSFPSGHSAASFAGAMSIYFSDKRWGRACLVLAFLIAFSRLYLYVHFPTDVIFGIMFGVFCAFASRKIITRMNINQ